MVDERQVARLNKALEPGAPVANEWLEMLDELGILAEIDPEFDGGHGLENAVRWVRKMRKGRRRKKPGGGLVRPLRGGFCDRSRFETQS
jgi:hypothetical protein